MSSLSRELVFLILKFLDEEKFKVDFSISLKYLQNCSEWEQITIPASVRSIVALNLNNYASGRNPLENLKPEYLEKRGFVEAHVDDGLLEIFGLKHGWHASFVMTELISAKHIAQVFQDETPISEYHIRDIRERWATYFLDRICNN